MQSLFFHKVMEILVTSDSFTANPYCLIKTVMEHSILPKSSGHCTLFLFLAETGVGVLCTS